MENLADKTTTTNDPMKYRKGNRLRRIYDLIIYKQKVDPL